MGQKYIYLLGGLLALYLGDSAWSKDTFCEKMCESAKGKWCQLDFIHKGCQEKCDASKLAACNQENLTAQADKTKLKQALGGLKKNFCEFACSASACKNEIFGAICVKSCSDNVTACKKAYEETLRKSLKEGTTVIPEGSVLSSNPVHIQNMGPANIPSHHSVKPLDTEMLSPPAVPIHGMGASPEIISEQPVPEGYRVAPGQTTIQRDLTP